MGLDIIPCKSLDWQKSISLLKLQEHFWDEHSTNIWGDPIFFQKLKDFCIEQKLAYTTDSLGIVQIDFGVKFLHEYTLRSCYNDSGVNSILRSLDIMDFYDIFNVTQKDLTVDFSFVPVDWNEASNKALFVIHELKNRLVYGKPVFDYIFGQMKRIIDFSLIVSQDNPDFYRVYWSS